MRNFGKIKMPIILIFVLSMTKFSSVIGSTNAYLLRNRRTNAWASIYEYPISTFSNWISVIRCPRNVLVNKLRWIAVRYSLKTHRKQNGFFWPKRSSQKTFLISKFVLD